jgi:hypothetical protein
VGNGARHHGELFADVELARSVYEATEPVGELDWWELAESNLAAWLAMGPNRPVHVIARRLSTMRLIASATSVGRVIIGR